MRLPLAFAVALGATTLLGAEAGAQPVERSAAWRNIVVSCPATVSGVRLRTVAPEDVTPPAGWSVPAQPYGYSGVELNVGSVNAYATQVTCNYVLKRTTMPPAQYTMVRLRKEFPNGNCRVKSASDHTAVCSVPNTSPVRRPVVPVERLKPPQGD